MTCSIADAQSAQAPLTAAAAVDTCRLMSNPDYIDEHNPQGAVSISPDGERYVVRLACGDVAGNRVKVELYTGGTRSLDAASTFHHIATLRSSGLGPELLGALGPHLDTDELASPIRWLDDRHVVFPWSDARGVRQILRIDLDGGDLRWLTRHARSVAAFDFRDGRLVFNALAPVTRDAATDARGGWVVPPHLDAYSLSLHLLSDASTLDRRMNTQWFVRSSPQAVVRQVQLPETPDLDVRHRVVLSANGQWALIDATPSVIPTHWLNYDNEDLRRWLDEAGHDRHAPGARNVHQWFVLDVQAGTARALWQVPSVATVTSAAWSPAGEHVLVAPTWLPASVIARLDAKNGAAGRRGESVAVVRVDDGAVEVVPVQLPAMRPLRGLRWLSESEIEVLQERAGSVHALRFKRTARGQWRRSDTRRTLQSGVYFRVSEDLQTPPRLIAGSPDGRTRVLLDLGRAVAGRDALERVERRSGVLADGTAWQALLFYPLHYRVGRRYPLVIQATYGGGVDNEFTLNGPQGGLGLGPTPLPVYAARLLAQRGIAVLHLDVNAGVHFNTPEEAPLCARAFKQLAAELVQEGLVERTRIGLLGFSRTGYRVEYALTHSDFPYAAALTADSWDPSYFQHLLIDDVERASAVNGAAPFGDGLHQWLMRAPGFNAERIRAPLRLVEMSHGGAVGVLSKWELFTRLRYLRRPVEYYVMPDAEHGAHNPQNPAQIIALQEGTVDWFDFWLNDHLDPHPDKAAQYQRWQELRRLRDQYLATLAPVPTP